MPTLGESGNTLLAKLQLLSHLFKSLPRGNITYCTPTHTYKLQMTVEKVSCIMGNTLTSIAKAVSF